MLKSKKVKRLNITIISIFRNISFVKKYYPVVIVSK